MVELTVMGSQADMPIPWQLLSLFKSISGEMTGLRLRRPPPLLLLSLSVAAVVVVVLLLSLLAVG